ncbi:lamin tail domain-containing protein [Amycolatopsis vancoresmycina]|uniref:lamin tail domain-containing protein n=1 Tax=Amycolatopsis vancoresmycina TaxID=208444 RepID=UPI000525781A|nr:lamin tail domain-containing protein [Amycolatopsis vancoresmycina]
MTVLPALVLALALGGLPAPAAAAPAVKIQEVLGGPAGYLVLRNAGTAAVDLGGWSVRSCTGGPAPVGLAELPAGAEIPAGGSFLIAAAGFGGTEAAQLVVPELPGDGQMLLDHRRVRADAVAWTASSPCREREAAVACPGLAESRDAASRDTDDNRADFSCVRSRT